jgi:hypothetical protein
MVCDDDQNLAVTRPMSDGLYEFFHRELLPRTGAVMTGPTASAHPQTDGPFGGAYAVRYAVCRIQPPTRHLSSRTTLGGPPGCLPS